MWAKDALQGRRAVVTGGSRGIGGAIASALAAAGAEVTVVARSRDACVAHAEAIGGVAHPCDVTDEAQLAALFASVAERGGADILVCAAGVSGSAPAATLSMADIDRMMDVHLKASLRAGQLAAPQMKENGGGAILFVTSVWGLGGQPGTLAYGTAKAAMAHAVKVLALEWARDGIRVNGLAPGFVDTDMTGDLPDSVREKLLRRIPLRRAGRPEEMAGPALLLCSDAGSYLTGQVLVVDGGERAR